MNLLFVCNQGRHRSKTAVKLFSGRFAGIYSEDNPLTKELLVWADKICVMEEHQRTFIANNFPKEYLQKKIVNLEIPDIYQYDQKKLKETLKKKMNNNN